MNSTRSASCVARRALARALDKEETLTSPTSLANPLSDSNTEEPPTSPKTPPRLKRLAQLPAVNRVAGLPLVPGLNRVEFQFIPANEFRWTPALARLGRSEAPCAPPVEDMGSVLARTRSPCASLHSPAPPCASRTLPFAVSCLWGQRQARSNGSCSAVDFR